MLVAYWHMFTTGETYRDLGGDYYQRRDPERHTKRLLAQLQALGHHVTLHNRRLNPGAFPIRFGRAPRRSAPTEALERLRERGEGGGVMAAATGRIITAVQRALTATDPLDALEALTHLRAALDAFEREQVRRALDQGESFAAIARAVGIARQAAHRRYRNLTIEPPAYAPRMLRRCSSRAPRRRGWTRRRRGRAPRPRIGGTRDGPWRRTRVRARIGPRLREILREMERPIDCDDVRRPARSSDPRASGAGVGERLTYPGTR